MISRFWLVCPGFDSGFACWQTCCHVDDQRPCRQLDHWCAALGARTKGLRSVTLKDAAGNLTGIDASKYPDLVNEVWRLETPLTRVLIPQGR
jgi:hypothetical protein